jgi:sortase A
LGDTLCYEVDQILIVEPNEVDSLRTTPGEDYVTLVTCTPYGVNSHRLLVRGHRIETPQTEVDNELPKERFNKILLIPPILLAAVLVGLFMYIKSKKKRG